MHRLTALLIKEVNQMRREPRTLVLSIVVPIVLLLLFGYAVTFDVREIRVVVRDLDNTPGSRELARAFFSSGYFREVGRAVRPADAERALDTGDASAALVFPRGFGRNIDRSVPAQVQFLLDGSDSSTATIMAGHARRIVQGYTGGLLSSRLRREGAAGGENLLPIDLQPRVLYNPELRSRNFMVPGLIGVLLTMLGVVQTSLAIAKERERGTLEQLRMTPLRAPELLIGKLAPYALVAFLNAWIALALGRYLLGVPVRGSLWLFAAGTLLFLISALGIGLVISSVTRTQMAAQSAAFLTSVLPVFYLSDYMFPIRNMPVWLQGVTYLLPARFYVTVLRGTLQKGVGAYELAAPLAALSIYAVTISFIGILSIRRAIR